MLLAPFSFTFQPLVCYAHVSHSYLQRLHQLLLALHPFCTFIVHLSNSPLSYLTSPSCTCLEPYNEPQHELLCESMLFVFHVCDTFVLQLSTSLLSCLFSLSFMLVLHLTNKLRTNVTCLVRLLHLSCISSRMCTHISHLSLACLHISHVFLACLSWTILISTWIFVFYVCSLSNFTSTSSQIELASLSCSFQLHVLRFQPNCNANFDLYWILSVIL